MAMVLTRSDIHESALLGKHSVEHLIWISSFNTVLQTLGSLYFLSQEHWLRPTKDKQGHSQMVETEDREGNQISKIKEEMFWERV